MAVLGLCFCARAFSSCGKRGPLFIVVRGPLTIVASLVAEHRLQTRRLSSRGSRAQLLCGMWDLPRPGLEPVSPALAGRFSTTAPPGKPHLCFFLYKVYNSTGLPPTSEKQGKGINSLCRMLGIIRILVLSVSQDGLPLVRVREGANINTVSLKGIIIICVYLLNHLLSCL